MVCFCTDLIDTIYQLKSVANALKIHERGYFLSTHWLSKSSFCAFFLAFVVITLGGYTRLTNAGLACPDWPNCFGLMTAPHTATQVQSAMNHYPNTLINTTKAWTEMVHRYFASVEALLILVVTASLWSSTKKMMPALFLMTLLALQVTLGMLTVTQQLKPFIVSLHLLTGVFILSLLWYIFLTHTSFPIISKSDPSHRYLFLITFILTAMQFSLGGWVSTHAAALACVDFPYCQGTLIPTLQWHHLNTDLVTIHMLHRLGALISATAILILSIYLLFFKSWRRFSIFLLMLVTLQLTLGVLNILWLRPTMLALLHQSVGIVLLLTILTGLVSSSFTPRDISHA